MSKDRNLYAEMRAKQQREFNEFPLGAAYNREQFREMMENWGYTEYDTDKIYTVCNGCFIRREDSKRFNEMNKRFLDEEAAAIEADETGEGFIYDMFICELEDHEYGYTYDVEETLDVLGYTMEDIMADKRLKRGLSLALSQFD